MRLVKLLAYDSSGRDYDCIINADHIVTVENLPDPTSSSCKITLADGNTISVGLDIKGVWEVLTCTLWMNEHAQLAPAV